MKQGDEDDHRITQILHHLKSDVRHDMALLARPFIIEFDGMPSCGKTTVIKELNKYFRHNGLRVCAPQEGAEAVCHIPRTTPEYNIRIALYTISMIMDLSWNHTYDLILLDRGIFDFLCWTDYMYDKNMITDEQAKTLTQFYLLPSFTEKRDCAVVMICDPKIALEREKNLELSKKSGFTTIESLHEFYNRSFGLFIDRAPIYSSLQLLDTTTLTRQKMTQCAKDIVLDRLSHKIKTA